jgi:hypothetical protein
VRFIHTESDETGEEKKKGSTLNSSGSSRDGRGLAAEGLPGASSWYGVCGEREGAMSITCLTLIYFILVVFVVVWGCIVSGAFFALNESRCSGAVKQDEMKAQMLILQYTELLFDKEGL